MALRNDSSNNEEDWNYDKVNIEINGTIQSTKSKRSILTAVADHEEKSKTDEIQSPQLLQSPQSNIYINDSNGVKDHEVFNLASIIFTNADLDHSGTITVEELMESTHLSMKLCQAIFRAMKCNDSSFTIDNLYNFIKILKSGSIESKVQVFMNFIDEDGNGGVNETEFNDHVKLKNAAINARLGFLTPGYELSFDSLLKIFMESSKGEDVINSFCNEILEILSKLAIDDIRDSKRKKKRSEIDERSYLERIRDFSIKMFKQCTESKKNRYLSVLVLLQLFLFLYYFCYYYVYLEKAQELAIAKGFGLNLRILSFIMFFTMSRSTMGQLYLVAYLEKIIPLGINLEIHSFLGFSVLFHSIGHVFAHISYEYIRTTGGPTATVLQKSLTNGGWDYRIPGGDGITGYILLAIILIMSTTAIFRGISSSLYAIFYHMHMIGYVLWIVFLCLHVYSLWPWWLAILILYVADMCYDIIFLTTVSNLSFSRPGPDGVTFLSLYSARHPEPGSYYKVKVPSISLTEWHSFSFAGNASSNHLKFFIASSGDWTSALHELVSDSEKRDKALVIVQGPFKAPAGKLFRTHYFDERQKVCLVASGIGITPFLSCIATNIMNAMNAESDKDTFAALFHEDLGELKHQHSSIGFQQENVKLRTTEKDDETRNLHVVWGIREIGELMFFVEYISCMTKLQSQLRQNVVTIDIYLTGIGALHDPAFLIAQTFFSLIVSDKTTSTMNIIYSRPNFDEIIQQHKPSSVYYCGGPAVRDLLDPICSKYKIKFRPEAFDDGGTFVRSVKEFTYKVFGKVCRSFSAQ